MKNNIKNKGFTIVELLVVIGIAVFMTTGLLVYNKTMERNLILVKEQMKVISALQKVKSLSIDTFVATSTLNYDPPCGWGVHFDGNLNEMIIFEEYPNIDQAGDCGRYRNNKYIPYDTADANGQLSKDILFKKINLDPRIKFSSLELSDIVFYPPNPDTIIDDDLTKSSALIKIQTMDGLSERVVKVTDSGQITAQ